MPCSEAPSDNDSILSPTNGKLIIAAAITIKNGTIPLLDFLNDIYTDIITTTTVQYPVVDIVVKRHIVITQNRLFLNLHLVRNK